MTPLPQNSPIKPSPWELVLQWINENKNMFIYGLGLVGATSLLLPGEETQNGNLLHRSYKMGVTGDVPQDTFCDISIRELRDDVTRAAQGVVRRTFGQYIRNQAILVNALSREGAPRLWHAHPNPRLHYGHARQYTGTSSNIGDSAGYHLWNAYKATLDLQAKANEFLDLLGQPAFALSNAAFFWTGYCNQYLLATLTARWHVGATWVRATLRGWRKRMDSLLPAWLNRGLQTQRMIQLTQYSQTHCPASPAFWNFTQRHYLTPVLFQDGETLLPLVFPPEFQPEARAVRATLHRTWDAVERGIIVNFLHPPQGPVTPYFRCSYGQMIDACTILVSQLDSALQTINTRGEINENLDRFRTLCWRVQQSPAALQYLASFTHLFPFAQFGNAVARGLGTLLGPGNWQGVVHVLYGIACMTRISAIPQLTALPDLALITPPFQSPRRRRHTLPVVLTSPKYVVFRPNSAALTHEIRTTGRFFLEMPHAPRDAATWFRRTENANRLTVDEQALIQNELSWGTSTRARNLRLRELLQSNPFFLIHLGIRMNAAQRLQLIAHPLVKQRVEATNLRVRINVPKKVREKLRAGAEVEQVLILPPANSSKKVEVVLQLKGSATALTSPPRWQQDEVRDPRTPIGALGVDVNKLGPDAMTVQALALDGTPIRLPASPQIQTLTQQLVHWNTKLEHCNGHISQCQAKLPRVTSNPRLRLCQEIRNLHHRREGIKRAVDHAASELLYRYASTYCPRIIGHEDLETLTTRGRRGHLATVITTMIKRWQPIVARYNAWATYLTPPVPVTSVSPANTSQIHYQCGGRLQRDLTHWDRAPCNRCTQLVATHTNSAQNIAARALRSL